MNIPRWTSRLSEPRASEFKASLADILLRGCYPEIASRPRVDRRLWCGSYLATYLERDVRNLANVGDLGRFERFLKLCAIRTGQLLNLSDLARDTGVSVPTAKRWISILETGDQVFLRPSYYGSIGKRLIRSPKIYFTDTGLATYLLGLHDRDALLGSPSYGALFETLVVTDVLKRSLHEGLMPPMYYVRTRDGLEVDLALEIGQKLILIEIKSAMTVYSKHAASLVRLKEDLGDRVKAAYLLSAARGSFPISKGISNLNWLDALAT
ncbi:MAG: DUF4143 domain-containing protein [Acidobacteria bacterium]|nr:DUF4143 domain-containing protein [Acidobacteriota bacterium]